MVEDLVIGQLKTKLYLPAPSLQQKPSYGVTNMLANNPQLG